MIDTLLRRELLIIDEIGFAPLDDAGAQLLSVILVAEFAISRGDDWVAAISGHAEKLGAR